jgi:hypothetical protein
MKARKLNKRNQLPKPPEGYEIVTTGIYKDDYIFILATRHESINNLNWHLSGASPALIELVTKNFKNVGCKYFAARPIKTENFVLHARKCLNEFFDPNKFNNRYKFLVLLMFSLVLFEIDLCFCLNLIFNKHFV